MGVVVVVRLGGGGGGGVTQLDFDRGHCVDNQILTNIPTASFCL